MKHSFKHIALRTLCLLLLTAVLLTSLVACSDDGIDEKDFKAEKSDETTDFVLMEISYTDSNGKQQVGKIVIQLFPEHAPITVANFKKLVGEGFYDGIIFHRVLKGQLIQGGDPKGNGTGGSSQNIKGEFATNGVTNNLTHIRGTISMARRGDPYYDSASSQFFIMQTDAPYYDGDYAAFGQVIYGMDTVDAIGNVRTTYNSETGGSGYPVQRVTIESAYFVTVDPQYRTTPTLNIDSESTSGSISDPAGDTVIQGTGGSTSSESSSPETGDSSSSTENDTSSKNDSSSSTSGSQAVLMSELDLTPLLPAEYEETASITEHVRLRISYTDASGSAQTGDVILRLYASVAPITVANFQSLVHSGFYNGLTFHRVLSGLLIQGGDPNGNGSGGSSQSIKGEFAINGVENNLSHIRGVISMARRGDPYYDSASSQFFIMNADYTYFDGSYAAFGYVVYGMETVNAISNTQTNYNIYGEKSVPANSVTILSATFLTKKA